MLWLAYPADDRIDWKTPEDYRRALTAMEE